jgi:glycosyltransferase involved in cell wall biosynthesis
MRTLLILKSELLPYSETFIKEQVQACSRWHPVLVGTTRVQGLRLDGLDIRLLPRVLPRVSLGPLRQVASKLWRSLDVAPPGTVRMLRKVSAELAHAHFGFEAVAFWPIVRRLGLPMAVTLHGVDIMTHREWWEQHGGFIGSQYPRRLLALGRSPKVHFVAVSQAIKQRAIEFGLPAERIDILHIGIDITRFARSGPSISRRSRRILYVGRMVEKKGGRYLIEAFARVRARVPDAELVMIGDGMLLDSLKQLAAELRVPVEFTGSLASDAVKAHIDAARVFCLPSIRADSGDAEGLGTVLLEAQACGVPTISSAGAGAEEGILHGVTGLTFAEKDVEALAAALLRLLQDDALAETMSEAAPRFVAERFDIRRCTSALEDYYDRIAS